MHRQQDELELLEFKSRQDLFKEDKIMRDRINNYVQLVAALTGEEVLLPMDDDEYTFVSVSSGHESLASDFEEGDEGEIEYILDEEDWEYESVGSDDEGETDKGQIEERVARALHSIEEGPEDISPMPPPPPPPPTQKSVDDTAPPTPSQIIRKLKATLAQAGMEQQKFKKKKSRRLDGSNWSYDMARRRLKRELNRVHMRKAYRDAIRTLPPLSRSISEEKLENSKEASPTVSMEETKRLKVMETTKTSAATTANNTAPASGTVFVNLLKTLEQARKPSETRRGKKISRSDERLQAILQKHHHSLMKKFPAPPLSQTLSIDKKGSSLEKFAPPPPPLEKDD